MNKVVDEARRRRIAVLRELSELAASGEKDRRSVYRTNKRGAARVGGAEGIAAYLARVPVAPRYGEETC
jgi:hypothetical protein